MFRIVCGVFLILLGVGFESQGQVIETLKWRTKYAAPIPELDSKKQQMLPLVQLAIQNSTESSLINMSGVAAQLFEVPADLATSLQQTLSKYYQRIDADPLFTRMPSSLGYCWSTSRPNYGQASVYRPKVISTNTRRIVFLHGFGGSLKCYLYFMISCFPDDIIICPAYGVSPSNINSFYLYEAVKAVDTHLGLQGQAGRKKALLIGLSAGGFGAFRLYAKDASRWQSPLIVLGAYPPPDVLGRSLRGDVTIVAGAQEGFVKDGTLFRHNRLIPNGNVTVKLIPSANHFFMLTHEAKTRAILQQ